MGKGPDFIGIGAQKCGTTWIYLCLFEHPEIYAPFKEIHFFDKKWSKGNHWYESFFKNKPLKAKAGEFTPNYLSCPMVNQRIFRYYPNTKLIISLRNPINRTISAHKFLTERAIIKPIPSLKYAIKQYPGLIVKSQYASHIKRYLQLFPRNQMLILIYEDIAKDPLAFIQKIYKFIGVDDHFIPPSLNKKINVTHQVRFYLVEKLITKIIEINQAVYMHHKIKKPFHNLVGLISHLNTKKNIIINPSKSHKKILEPFFKNDIKELEKLINRKLTEWY